MPDGGVHMMVPRTPDEIAEIMDLPLGTVKTYLHRARNELKKKLEDVA